MRSGCGGCSLDGIPRVWFNDSPAISKSLCRFSDNLSGADEGLSPATRMRSGSSFPPVGSDWVEDVRSLSGIFVLMGTSDMRWKIGDFLETRWTWQPRTSGPAISVPQVFSQGITYGGTVSYGHYRGPEANQVEVSASAVPASMGMPIGMFPVPSSAPKGSFDEIFRVDVGAGFRQVDVGTPVPGGPILIPDWHVDVGIKVFFDLPAVICRRH